MAVAPCALELASMVDADEIATLYIASRADALPYVRIVHTDNEAGHEPSTSRKGSESST